MNWDNWAEDMFIMCIKGIKKTDPIKNELEWKLYWDLLAGWRTFREEKSKHKIDAEGK